MVVGGTLPPLHISGPTIYRIFSTVNTVIGPCCDEDRQPMAEFMRESIVFSSIRVRCRRKKVHVRYLISSEFLFCWVRSIFMTKNASGGSFFLALVTLERKSRIVAYICP